MRVRRRSRKRKWTQACSPMSVRALVEWAAREIESPQFIPDEPLRTNQQDQVPDEIAVQHARMAVCAMRCGDEPKAIRAIQRAFEIAREIRQEITLDDHVSRVASVRTTALLESAGIETLRQLIALSADDLILLQGVSRRTAAAIERELAKHGLALSAPRQKTGIA